MRIRLLNNSIWATIQGEGHFCGVPSVFVRLAGCDLCCSWCDTPASLPDYDREARHFELRPTSKAVDVEVEDATHLIVDCVGDDFRHLVVTGGEPMLQQKAVVELIRAVCKSNSDDIKPYVTIESNCETKPEEALLEAVDFVSLSPKPDRYVRGIGPSLQAKEIQDVYRAWGSKQKQLKIVVTSRQEIHQAVVIIDHLAHIDVPAWAAVQIEASWLREGWLPHEERVEVFGLLARAGIRLVAQMHPILRVA